MKTGNFDLEEVSTVLATRIIQAAHITTFVPDGSVDPITYRAPEGVQTKVQKFLEKELSTLLGKAA